MKCPLLAIVRRHTERGPDAAGATSENLLPRRPRRGQAAAPLAFSGLRVESCAFGSGEVRPLRGMERMRAELACFIGVGGCSLLCGSARLRVADSHAFALKAGGRFADSCLTPGPGTDGNHSCGLGALRRPTRTRPPPTFWSKVPSARHSEWALDGRAGEARPTSGRRRRVGALASLNRGLHGLPCRRPRSRPGR
jgi:hypothetical protein